MTGSLWDMIPHYAQPFVTPAAAPPTADVSASAFRSAMATVPTSVSVLTVEHRTGVWGMTIGSLTSLSLDPPRLLVCLRWNSATLRLFGDRGGFGVNVLAADQAKLADRFAQHRSVSPAREFEHRDGIPYLAEAMTTFLCHCVDTHRHADHVIVIAAVDHVRANTDHPLLRQASRYQTLSSPPRTGTKTS